MLLGDAAEILQLFAEAAQYFPFMIFKRGELAALDETTGRYTTYVKRLIAQVMRKLQRSLWPSFLLWGLHNWAGWHELPFMLDEHRMRTGIAIGKGENMVEIPNPIKHFFNLSILMGYDSHSNAVCMKTFTLVEPRRLPADHLRHGVPFLRGQARFPGSFLHATFHSRTQRGEKGIPGGDENHHRRSYSCHFPPSR